MNTLAPPLSARKRRRPGGALIAKLLPVMVKRVVFLTTLFTSVERMRGVIEPRLQVLNDELSLATSTDLLKRCSEITHLVWKGEVPIDPKEDLLSQCRKALESMPRCLWYAKPDKMRDDVTRVLLCRAI